MATATSSVQRVSATVGSTRWPIRRVTGRLVKMEVPRSPCRRPHTHVPKRTTKGSSRPSPARMRLMSSVVAASPAMTAAGSPGVRYSREKTTNATTVITTRVAKSLRITYASIDSLRGLFLVDVPEERDGRDDDARNIRAIGRRQDELPRRNERHELERALLDG